MWKFSMVYLWNKFKALRNYLAYQIFAYFALMIVLVLSLALALPKFDARIFNPIEDKELHFFNQESQNTQLEYNLDEIFNRNLKVTTLHGFNVILFDQDTNTVVGVDKKHLNALRAFIFRANNPLEPLQRRFGIIEIHGPFLVSTGSQNYYQYFIDQVDPQMEVFNAIFDSPILILLILFAIFTPLLIGLSLRIAKPVKALRLSADAVATGNLTIDEKLETEGISELRQVGKSFNRMILSLQKLTSYQQRLLSDISHELKTPLTRMQLAVSLIRRRNGESNELTRIENEIQKLDTMIHDLLSLSRQQVNLHLRREIFPINKIWEDIFADAKFELEQHNLDFLVSLRVLHPERFYINGNVATLSSAVENVVRNAKKYATSCIKVIIYIEKNDLVIIIDDDGTGVPDDQYEEIFRPFYRVAEDRARQTGGTGLGLAIVYNAIQQHKGIVGAEKSPLGGLRIKIQLPLWLE
ncbi:envelope stress sensor histidine kinase CpxA [Ursidibacter maritimus]|uniref:histidine kinase n=3 Tax=Ursidibacter maritimus TaxID=1331689 RepID=A0A949T5U3_9PAST|nr:envelope stress sensor histidine kinase CpxA [Ursidibacter maritimus]KAE9539314.1 two-component system sensor histidine kinase CpxA [Ursidibacter maritimus]MBV6524465.1 envelope stress sensor histidine kinase CpxA [Ursidibacter maritimus]MBV6526160.1 envelope stress sensor histidine kinase CpxA [Ursidibacter maritimus]MBV6527002.1 envelope stress sensor histidine kinase CpxA [Ursidibacter maritimus]MBV6528775.1 envelope stress sensor histidine kinase CpxA [Ursidibacter maritimus]